MAISRSRPMPPRLQVVTSYSTIDRQPLDRDLYRKLAKGERTMIRDLVDYAAQVANGLLVPTGFPRDTWRDLGPPERFYVRMLDMEAKGATKVADFQNFAKSFAYRRLCHADGLDRRQRGAPRRRRRPQGPHARRRGLRQDPAAAGAVRDLEDDGGQERDPKRGVTILKTEYAADYWQRRQKLIGLAEYVAAKTKNTRPEESAAAHELAEALKLDRV